MCGSGQASKTCLFVEVCELWSSDCGPVGLIHFLSQTWQVAYMHTSFRMRKLKRYPLSLKGLMYGWTLGSSGSTVRNQVSFAVPMSYTRSQLLRVNDWWLWKWNQYAFLLPSTEKYVSVGSSLYFKSCSSQCLEHAWTCWTACCYWFMDILLNTRITMLSCLQLGAICGFMVRRVVTLDYLSFRSLDSAMLCLNNIWVNIYSWALEVSVH